MSVKYLDIRVTVAGLDITDRNAEEILCGAIKETVHQQLINHNIELFNFREMLNDDVDVWVVQRAGEYLKSVPGSQK